MTTKSVKPPALSAASVGERQEMASLLPSNTDRNSAPPASIIKRRSSTENSTGVVADSSLISNDAITPAQLFDDPAAPKVPGPHKMSVPLVTIPSSVTTGRSRLSSFNLPLFNTGTKPNFFSTHKRRGSNGKNLVKSAKTAVMPKTGVPDDETVLDMDELSKMQDLAGDGKLETVLADRAAADEMGSGDGGNTAVISSQSGIHKRAQQVNGSSAAKSTLTDEELLSSTDGQKVPDVSHKRSCDQSADDADLQRTEHGLLTLLDDFNAGRLKAFGSSDASAALRGVREMQERLAKSHFDMYALQEKVGFDNPKLTSLSLSTWQSLMAGMHELTDAVHRLGTSSTVSQTAESPSLSIPNADVGLNGL